ncbi:MAG: polysaccharide deacetylase family protein [Chthoniobacter sp.]|nr:polysaccharide deacetylase family protein [Chthoniobacter sp.]
MEPMRRWLTQRGPAAAIQGRWPWPLKKPYERSQLRVYSVGGGLGDELMCTPVFREIKRRNPDCHLTFISRHPDLFRSHPSLDAVVPFEKKALLRAVPLTYGWVVPPPRPLITLLGECVGFSFFDNQLDPPPTDPSAGIQQQMAAISRPAVVIQPLASRWTPNKVWPRELWRDLVKSLLDDFDVIEVGTEALFAADEFGPGFHAWAGKTSLKDFVWLVSRATVFVGPPSGGMHLANGFQVPSVILYGGYESPDGHRYPRMKALYREVPCAPCWLREDCPYHLKCLRMITVSDVEAAVRSLASQRPPLAAPTGEPLQPAWRIETLPARPRTFRDSTRPLLETFLRPIYSGIGSIVVLHRIVRAGETSLQPSNRALEITVDDLRAILEWIWRVGLDPVSLDEVPQRLAQPRPKKFISITLDDGYRDNLLHALPLFQEFEIPFTVSIATGFPSRTASAWWHEIEVMTASVETLRFNWAGTSYKLPCDTMAARQRTFEQLATLIREQGRGDREALLTALGEATGHDPMKETSRLMMTWDEVRTLAADPLATIGAHTVGHHSLNRLTDSEVRAEMLDSKGEIEAQLKREVRHFAYPFGGRSAVNEREFEIARTCGFATMLTTRMANLFPEHGALLDRLPRLGMSGNYPVVSNLSAQESGLASAWHWKFRRLVTT